MGRGRISKAIFAVIGDGQPNHGESRIFNVARLAGTLAPGLGLAHASDIVQNTIDAISPAQIHALG